MRLDTNLPRGDWLPPAAESVQAFHSLESMGRAGIVQSLRVILELPSGSISKSERGWNAVVSLSRKLAADPRTDRVISISTLTENNRDAIATLTSETRRSFLRSDGRADAPGTSACGLGLDGRPDRSGCGNSGARTHRRSPALPAPRLRIGGIPALNADYESTVREKLPVVIALVVGGTLIALLIGFRSLIAALKAIALNLLSVSAAFGALVLVFQDGHGSQLFGVREATGGVFPIVPILTFAIVFGLSMDYEVFLVARVLEVRRTGVGESEAISEGLARTAGLITSAAAIMIVVFTGLHSRRFSGGEDARLYARRGRIDGCDARAHGHRPGSAQSRRRLELVALGSSRWCQRRPQGADCRTGALLMPRERVEIREANEADNEALLALTRATPMAGTISLRIDRDPDFFALLRLRGEGKVFVAARGREVVGCISAAMRTVYVAGVPETIAYVGDMKVHPTIFRKPGRAAPDPGTRERPQSRRDRRLLQCGRRKAIERAMPLFEGRLGIPRWIPLGRFLVDELLPAPFRGRSKHYRIEAAEPADLPAIAALLDRFHRSRQFAPRLPEDEVADALTAGGTFVARAGKQIVATLTLSDMGPIKRNVLLNAPVAMKGSLALLRLLHCAASWLRCSEDRGRSAASQCPICRVR